MLNVVEDVPQVRPVFSCHSFAVTPETYATRTRIERLPAAAVGSVQVAVVPETTVSPADSVPLNSSVELVVS